jgi:hypothetical protein
MANNNYNYKIQKNNITLPLINEIEEYVEGILDNNIPQIQYSSYIDFYENGIRKSFEDTYFERRKQLTALGFYLQFNNSKKAISYFKELLWSISNEFSWCLAAHLEYDDNGLIDGADKNIDLFSAETAQTLSELVLIHKDKLDNILINHIKRKIKDNVINPFLNREFHWETATHNWSAVCSGCIGITALLLEQGERLQSIINRVENALKYYLSGFGSDGVSLEGIGYWTYGFGYYIYYKALRGEKLSQSEIEKLIAIANFPQRVQISAKEFVPFSDVTPNMELPSGLISYLYENYDIKVPYIKEITSFNFDHCYRWAHISRNLWWTTDKIFNIELKSDKNYFSEAQWFTLRDNNLFFAIKGGNNNEPHNHNDLGSFIIAVDGKLVITDLGAGPYTAGYFGSERYNYDHTRSYYHSVPLINESEQQCTKCNCKIEYLSNIDSEIDLKLDISKGYKSDEIENVTRRVNYKYSDRVIEINDFVRSRNRVSINDGFISYIEPKIFEDGIILWNLTDKYLKLKYDNTSFDINVEKKEIKNHYNESITVYRLGLINSSSKIFDGSFKFYIE